MNPRRAVAVYTRISQDRSGDEKGVTRQLDDCRAEAERRGWIVAEEYIDDDVSAFSGRKRPAYERMLADLSAGTRDAVMVWHMDRLHRRPIELERFIEVCTRAGVNEVVTLFGDTDLAKGDGLLMARLLSAVAANESESKRRRGARKALEIAQSGMPLKGGPRAFGFLDDRVTHHPAEAPVVRELAARVLAGEALHSVTMWLDEADVRTVTGKPWRSQTVRQMLTNPRMWGMRVHQGTVIGKAVWDPIISPEDGERLRRKLLDPARRTNRTARRYLLSGMLRCGVCGATLKSTPKEGRRRYGCSMVAGTPGCGRIFIFAEMLEEFIVAAVLHRLDSPGLLTAADPGGDERQRVLAAAIDADDAKLKDLADMWADGELSRAEWKSARDRITVRREAATRDLARLRQADAIVAYVGRGEELRASWATLNLSRQVAIVKTVLAGATIMPASKPGRTGLDPERVVPEWRL